MKTVQTTTTRARYASFISPVCRITAQQSVISAREEVNVSHSTHSRFSLYKRARRRSIENKRKQRMQQDNRAMPKVSKDSASHPSSHPTAEISPASSELCRECHDELEQIIPQFNQLPDEEYFAIAISFLKGGDDDYRMSRAMWETDYHSQHPRW